MSVVNCKVKYIRPKYDNLKQWIEDPNNVYVGRGGVVFVEGKRFPSHSSVFSNPFKIGEDGTRDEVLAKYRDYMYRELCNSPQLQAELWKLRGKNLGCWCAPEPCHANILLEFISMMQSV